MKKWNFNWKGMSKKNQNIYLNYYKLNLNQFWRKFLPRIYHIKIKKKIINKSLMRRKLRIEM